MGLDSIGKESAEHVRVQARHLEGCEEGTGGAAGGRRFWTGTAGVKLDNGPRVKLDRLVLGSQHSSGHMGTQGTGILLGSSPVSEVWALPCHNLLE